MAKETYERISQVLSEKFVKTEQVARILSLAFAGKKFVILYGPGGHGKSQMVEQLQRNADLLGYDSSDFFFQFFGEGMDEAKLYGNIDFAAINSSDNPRLEYRVEDSFLNSKVAIFEELFDAPASVLLSLKDTLTAGALRNGAQRFKMKTEVIICLTNRSPDEVSELGASAHALTERFPLQLNVEWESYKADDYKELLEKVAPVGPQLNGQTTVLAELLAKATADGQFVSPRTAVHAYTVCQTAARLRGSDHVSFEDLSDLRYVDGLTDFGQEIVAAVELARAEATAKTFLDSIKEHYENLTGRLDQVETPIKAMQVAKRFAQLRDELSEKTVTDSYADWRTRLIKCCNQQRQVALAKAEETTRIGSEECSSQLIIFPLDERKCEILRRRSD